MGLWAVLTTGSAGCARTYEPPLSMQSVQSDDAAVASPDAGKAVECSLPSGNIRDFPDAGPCDDSRIIRIAAGEAPPKDVLGQYALTCDAVTPGSEACVGLPNDIWGACALRRCASTESYPRGCMVYLPTQNPYYPGPGQACDCTNVPGETQLRWLCGL